MSAPPRGTPPWRISVVIEIETDDRRLSPDRINHAPRSAEETATTRQAVMDNLLNTKRVVLVTGPEMMMNLLDTHELAAQIVGMEGMFSRPAADYEAPDDRARGTTRRRRPH